MLDTDLTAQHVEQAIHSLISQKMYPCVPAQRSLAEGEYLIGIYDEIGSGRASAQLIKDVLSFRDKQKESRSMYMTFWAVFKGQSQFSEAEFESRLWRELSDMASQPENDQPWDSHFSSDPSDENFCPSFGGDAFFIVGLHPNSSRLARRFPYPAIVFNLYDQFEELSRRGQYESIVKANRMREMKFQGSLNPMVEKYGDKWEAIQFSGRDNSPEWKCPFHQKLRQEFREQLSESGAQT